MFFSSDFYLSLGNIRSSINAAINLWNYYNITLNHIQSLTLNHTIWEYGVNFINIGCVILEFLSLNLRIYIDSSKTAYTFLYTI